MRIRNVVAGVGLALPLVVALPGPASAECVNGINASVAGDASQTNDCTTTVETATPTTPTVPPPPTP